MNTRIDNATPGIGNVLSRYIVLAGDGTGVYPAAADEIYRRLKSESAALATLNDR
jgi:hypothetical protein